MEKSIVICMLISFGSTFCYKPRDAIGKVLDDTLSVSSQLYTTKIRLPPTTLNRPYRTSESDAEEIGTEYVQVKIPKRSAFKSTSNKFSYGSQDDNNHNIPISSSFSVGDASFSNHRGIVLDEGIYTKPKQFKPSLNFDDIYSETPSSQAFIPLGESSSSSLFDSDARGYTFPSKQGSQKTKVRYPPSKYDSTIDTKIPAAYIKAAEESVIKAKYENPKYSNDFDLKSVKLPHHYDPYASSSLKTQSSFKLHDAPNLHSDRTFSKGQYESYLAAAASDKDAYLRYKLENDPDPASRGRLQEFLKAQEDEKIEKAVREKLRQVQQAQIKQSRLRTRPLVSSGSKTSIRTSVTPSIRHFSTPKVVRATGPVKIRLKV